MLILCDLLKIIETVQYAQNIIRYNINFKKKCYIDCFLQKEFCKDIINIYLITLQILKCNNDQKDLQSVKLNNENKDIFIINIIYL